MNNAQVDKLWLQGDFIISTWVVIKIVFSLEIRGLSHWSILHKQKDNFGQSVSEASYGFS